MQQRAERAEIYNKLLSDFGVTVAARHKLLADQTGDREL